VIVGQTTTMIGDDIIYYSILVLLYPFTFSKLTSSHSTTGSSHQFTCTGILL
jgi:hypothetical protein